jgi:hypothetical protein
MNKAKLSFEFLDIDDEFINREASKIEFIVPDNMNIWEYKIMCVRLAQAIGYQESSIKLAFGDNLYDKLDESNNIFKINLNGELDG